MPVAIVLNTFEAGGTEHQMTELICRVDHDRFDIAVACFGNRGPLRDRLERAGVPITEFRLHKLASAGTASQLLRFVRWCRARSIRAVLACDFYANVFALPAAAVAGVPVRIGSRRDVFIPERTRGQRRLQQIAYRFAHRIVANSQAAGEILVAEGVAARAIILIANGIDLARFPARAHDPARPVVTTVANLRPGKGHDILLRAARRVLDRRPGVHFRIVGDGPLRGAIEALARTLGIIEHVQLLGHRSDVPSLLASSTVFAFPSLMEAAPNAVLEAMAAGLPIVASDAGGIPEVIGHGRTGLLVPPGNPESLAEGILRLLDDERVAQALGAEARRTIEARFSFDRMTSQFESLILDELAARRGSKAVLLSPTRT